MICVGFGTNDKWTSRLIRWATRSEWSHAWIEYPSSILGGRWAVHAGPNGVVPVPIEQVEEAYPKRKLYECSVNLDLGFQWARNRIGAKYDYGVIWNGIILVLHRVTGWEWLNEVVTRNAVRMSCSEFVAGILKASGVDGTADMDIELTPPGDLERLCHDSGDFWVA